MQGLPLSPLANYGRLCCCAAAAADDNSIKSCTLSLCVNLSVWHVVRSHFYCRHCFSAHTHTHTGRAEQRRAEQSTHTHIVTLHVRFVPFLSLGFSSLDNALHGSLSPSSLPHSPSLLCACHIPCLCGGNKSSCGQRRDADIDANCAVRTISNSASCSLSLCAPFA